MGPSRKHVEQQTGHLKKATGMELHFLPGLGRTYSSQVRALVLRNYWRQSKNDARSAEDSRRDADPIPTQSSAVDNDGLGTIISAVNQAITEDEDGDDGQLIPMLPLSTQLGQERIDPFETSAMGKTNKIENLLVDHYINVALSHFGYRRKDAFRPPSQIHWAFLRGDKLTILAVMQYSAFDLANLLPERWRISMAYKYVALCIRELSERLKAEYSYPSDAILHAMVGLIATTRQSRRQLGEGTEPDGMAIHAQGLRLAIVARGGWKPSGCTHSTRHDLTWHDILFDGLLSAGYTEFSEHLEPRLLLEAEPKINPISTYTPAWSWKCTHEFIGAYTNFYNLALARFRPPVGTHKSTTKVSFIDLFKPETPAHSILCRPTSACAALRPIAVLIYINIMLWNFRTYSSDQMSELYVCYRANMRRTDVDLGSGTELLMFALGINMDSMAWANEDWIHLLTRMMSVECKLSANTRRALSESLLGFVAGREKQAVKQWWRPEYVRNIVLSELGYVTA